jgi:uncharacterized membrane-anchored protein
MHTLLRRIAPAAAALALAVSAHAQDITPEEFESRLGYRSGRIELGDGLATLEVPSTFRFIPPEGARRLLEDAWGNPPGAGDGVLGMLVPASVSPLADEGWGVVITFDEDGWVNDQDAATIDYTKLLGEMQEQASSDNAARRRQGYEPVRLVGWAEPPSYNAQTHKLYWAKELAFGEGDKETRTLNYNVRVLGRRGVLVLNAVAGMNQLQAVRGDMGNVLGFVEFNEGHRYTDYLPGTDRAAAYGVAGLIAGGVAAKAGFFKVLLAGLLAAKKLLVVAAVAVAGFVRRLLGGKSEPKPGSTV